MAPPFKCQHHGLDRPFPMFFFFDYVTDHLCPSQQFFSHEQTFSGVEPELSNEDKHNTRPEGGIQNPTST